MAIRSLTTRENTVHRREPSDDATKELAAENERLKATVGRLEERLKVLERIATDPSRQLADEIGNLARGESHYGF